MRRESSATSPTGLSVCVHSAFSPTFNAHKAPRFRFFRTLCKPAFFRPTCFQSLAHSFAHFVFPNSRPLNRLRTLSSRTGGGTPLLVHSPHDDVFLPILERQTRAASVPVSGQAEGGPYKDEDRGEEADRPECGGGNVPHPSKLRAGSPALGSLAACFPSAHPSRLRASAAGKFWRAAGADFQARFAPWAGAQVYEPTGSKRNVDLKRRPLIEEWKDPRCKVGTWGTRARVRKEKEHPRPTLKNRGWGTRR